jgi:hypothetical protein
MTVEMTPESGVNLSITSDRFGLLGAAYEDLGNEIKPCVPWWGFVRRYWVKWAYISLAAGLGGGAATRPGSLCPTVIGAVLGLAVAFLSGRLLLLFLLGFEVVPVGGTPKGRRALGVVGAIALSAAGVVAGIIYAATQASPKK